MRTIDRYLSGMLLRGYATVVIAIVAMLALENLPRLSKAVEHVSAPLPLLGASLLALLPEYLAIANPVAVYLATAWTIRSLALRGEWQVLAATGMRPARAMMMPVVATTLATGLQIAVRADFEPRGERRLDTLSTAARAGAFGIDIPLGRVVAVAEDTDLLVEPGADGGYRAFIRHGSETMTADRAEISRDADGALSVMLTQGRLVVSNEGQPRATTFGRLTLKFDDRTAAPPAVSPADRMDRLTFTELQPLIADETARGGRAPATSSLLARVQNALFCLALPWFALAFAVPPRRSAGGPAILLGLVLIVVNLRTGALVEQLFSGMPVGSAAVHVAAWALCVVALIHPCRRAKRAPSTA